MVRLVAFLDRHRRPLIWFGGTLAVLAAVAVGLPFAARFALADWLRADGAQQASIERVVVDYLEPSIEIRGLKVEDKAGKVLRLDRVNLVLDLPGLLHRRLHARALTVDGGTIELIQTDGGKVRVAGIPTAPESAEKPPEPPTDSSPWLIGADKTAVDGLEVHIHAPQGSQDFTIETARLGNIAMWAGDAPTALRLAVAAGQGNMEVGGEATPLGSAPSVAIDLDVKSFDLSHAALVPGMENVGGTLAGKLKLKAVLPPDASPEIHLAGTASLNGLRLKKTSDAPSLGSLTWTGEASLGANAGGALTARLTGKLVLGNLAVGTNTVRTATLSDLDARATYDAKAGVEANVTGTLEASDLALALSDAKGAADTLRWNGAIHFASSQGNKVRIETKGTLDVATATYASGGAQGRVDRLHWAGNLRTTASSSVDAFDVDAKGDLSVEAPRYSADGEGPDKRVTASLARIAYRGLDAKVSAAPNGSLKIDLGGALEASDIQASAGGDSFADNSLAWNGTVNVATQLAGTAEITLDGTMDGKGIALDLGSLGYKAAQREIHWQGNAKLGGATPTMAASVRMAGATVDATEPALRLLDVGRLSLDGATLDAAGHVAVKQVEADSFRAFGREGATDPTDFVAAVGTFAAGGIDFAPDERIAAESVRMGDAEIELERDEEGKLRLVGLLAALRGDNKSDKSSSETPRIVVGDLTLDGKSRIGFIDRSIDPPAKIALGPVTLHLGDLDSAKPERAVPLELKGELGRYSRLDLKGTAKPFAPRLNVDVEGKLTAFELTSLSGYLSQFLGYNLSRGRLDTDAHVKIVDGTLDSDSRVTITNLAVAEQQNEASRGLRKSLDMSLDSALSLLRDSDDVIRLNVPVTGDISSPNFDLSDAINTAIGNAMKRTVTTLLTVAFPLGGLIVAIVDSSGDKTLKFQPIVFEGGEVDLDSKAKNYLDTLARLLDARPGVKITACGVSTERDAADILRVRKEKAEALTKKRAKAGEMLPKEEAAPVTRDELYDLSHRRSEAVKDYLVGRKGVSEARVFICAPNVAADPNAAPHAEITL